MMVMWNRSYHSCQPLLRVNLSPVFVNPYFPYAGQGLLFFAGGSSILNSTGMCGSGRKKQCCAKYTCMTSNLTSSEISKPNVLGQSVCIWRWRVLAACSTVFGSFFLSLKQQQNLMKTVFSCIHFAIWPQVSKLVFYAKSVSNMAISPQNNEFLKFLYW